MKLRDYYKVIEMLIEQLYLTKKKKLDNEQLRDIATFVSGMSLSLEDNSTIDPAIWYDWMEAVDGKKALTVAKKSVTKEYGTIKFYDVIEGKREKELSNKNLTTKKGYDAAIRFLKSYADRLQSKNIKEFANQLTFKKWKIAVEQMLSKVDDEKTY